MRVERRPEQKELSAIDVEVDRGVPADADDRRRQIEPDEHGEHDPAGADEPPPHVQRLDRDPFAVGAEGRDVQARLSTGHGDSTAVPCGGRPARFCPFSETTNAATDRTRAAPSTGPQGRIPLSG